ncbi:hypothetical protein GCWU000324_02129 [Kingella oralis ATCC 51147]|jgi:hypothetical protein|uniref:Uncharacterized protein n=1 Tax=Kingella oralis ATCC 51147 TaxID=629741 RepID=C4GJA6_9NEIS|nr:hypothetical protein GCWU000324_02129 [Kingella oralis ATCC 51147]
MDKKGQRSLPQAKGFPFAADKKMPALKAGWDCLFMGNKPHRL